MEERLTTSEYWADIYKRAGSKRFSADPGKYRGHMQLDSLFTRIIPRQRALNIIEMGCGNSIWLPYFARKFGLDVWGLDYSESGCELARRNLQRAGVRGNILCRDFLDDIPDMEHGFDIVISMGVIEHFPKPDAIVQLFMRFLRHGGVMITIVPNLHGIFGTLQKKISKEIYDGHRVFDLHDLMDFHTLNHMKVLHGSYLRFLDPSVVNLSPFSERTRRYWGRWITLASYPLLLCERMSSVRFQSRLFCSEMVVVAAPPPALHARRT
ncbi:MAG: class I SAM-dependent methyltransferase [Planctomycetes bacterium]|nr:class I SAM-dependent methyltransferase [Planctomycetota bacterium]